MFIVSYYDVSGQVRNREVPSYTRAEEIIAKLAMNPRSCPIILADVDGHVLRTISK